MMSCILAGLLCLVMAHCAGADDFMHGVSRLQVVESMGAPLREIETDKGALLFYGSVFLEIADQEVVFINVPSRQDLERQRTADAARGIHWGGTMPAVAVAIGFRSGYHREMTRNEQEDWLDRRRRLRERALEARVRRFLLTRTFVNMLGVRRIADYPATPWYDSKYGHGVSVSLLDIKDSRSVRVPAAGEEKKTMDRNIDFGEYVLSPVLAQASVR